ncbi:hypothetical protein CRUP_010437, partial [Coryphaenoides rupestris]
SKWKTKPELSQYQCQNSVAAASLEDLPGSEDCLQLHSQETRASDKEPPQEAKPVDPPNRRTLSSSSSKASNGGETREPARGQGSAEPAVTPEPLPQEEQGGRVAQAPVKSTSPKAPRSRGHATTPLPPPPPSAPKTDKKQRSNSKTWAGHGADAVDKAAQSHHTEQINNIGYPVVYLGFDATCYFTNIFKLRAQKAVQSDNHFHMYLLQHSLPQGLQLYPKTAPDGAGNSKWKTKPELSQQEHSETQMLRKRVKEVETEYKQLQLECQALQQYRCVERDAVAMLSTLSALQDKAQHLEYNLNQSESP